MIYTHTSFISFSVTVIVYRAISTRMDLEYLKIMGNEHYISGRFAYAFSPYDAAIFLDPEKASHISNNFSIN